MRQRVWWFWTFGLLLFILGAAVLAWRQTHEPPPAGKPAPGLIIPHWWPPRGAIIGVDAPLSVTLPWPVSVPAVRAALTVSGGTAVRIRRGPDNRVTFLPPPGGWPPGRRLRFRLSLRRLYPGLLNLPAVSGDTLTTDDDRTIVVNLTHQSLQVYQAGQLVRTMPVSTGAPPNYVTPTGTFWIFRRVRLDRMRGGTPGEPGAYDVPHVPFSQYIFGGIAIHGAYWNRRFGVPRSHGCIQLATREYNPDPTGVAEDAGWLWHWAHLGDPVMVTGSTPDRPTVPARYPTSPAQRSV